MVRQSENGMFSPTHSTKRFRATGTAQKETNHKSHKSVRSIEKPAVYSKSRTLQTTYLESTRTLFAKGKVFRFIESMHNFANIEKSSYTSCCLLSDGSFG